MGARTAMITGMLMPTDARLLTLAQWMSPSFPVGAFAYSHGLEWAVQSGQIISSSDVHDWLTDLLRHGAGNSDAVFLSAAYRGLEPVEQIDALALAMAPSKERRMEAILQGEAFAATVRDVWGHDIPASTLAVVVGAAARQQGLPLTDVISLFLHAFASNQVSAAIRLVPLGQTDGQRILADVASLCVELAETAAGATLDDIGPACLLGDIASMNHETQYSRLFRS